MILVRATCGTIFIHMFSGALLCGCNLKFSREIVEECPKHLVNRTSMRAMEKSTYVSGTSSIFFAFSCYTQRVLGLSYFLRGQAIWAKILNTEDTIKLIKKLSISCDPDKPKRPLLDSRYPNLCPIIDQITIEDLEVNATFTIRHFLKQLKLTKDQDAQLMAYK